MVPLQVYNSLQVPAERSRLMQIRQLIIGGGAIDDALAAALKSFPHAVWSTYGMTETLSHIALRRLNGPEASDCYTPFRFRPPQSVCRWLSDYRGTRRLRRTTPNQRYSRTAARWSFPHLRAQG